MGSNFDSDGLAKKKIPTYSTWDPMLLRAEFVNGYMHPKTGKFTPNKFNVYLYLDHSKAPYIAMNGKDPGPPMILIKPGEFKIVNHSYYIYKGEGLPYGEPFQMIHNFGDKIGIRNTTPSNVYGLNG